MRSTDRPEFEKHVAELLAGFDRKNTPERVEAYWRGCMTMPLGVFERAVDRALGENGPDDIPSPKRMWIIARELRAAGAAPSTPQEQQPTMDPLQRLAVACLTDIVKRLGVPSHASADAMLEAKNRILTQLRDSYGGRDLTEEEAQQLRDVITPACEKKFELRTPEEIAADIEHWVRTGQARTSAPDELQTSAAA